MKRFLGMWRDTWLMWVALLVGGILAGVFVKSVFYLTLPITFFTFVYFSLVRYDEDGNHRTMDE